MCACARLRVEFARVATVPCGVDWQETLAGCPPVRPAQFLFYFFWNKADEVEEEERILESACNAAIINSEKKASRGSSIRKAVFYGLM